jgi:hypothetical protein
MAGIFDYTFKSWDKLRPPLLKSTGLGDALKKYEAKKNALKSARALSDLMKLRGETEAALEAVEVARKQAGKSCGSLFRDCKAALERADSARELERASGYALTMLNGAIVEGAKEIKDNKVKLDTRLKIAEDNLRALTKISKGGIVGKSDNDLVEKTKKIYAGEGDDAVLEPDGLIRDMLLNRSKLASSFPTVSADLAKMSASVDASKKVYLDYNKQKALIRRMLSDMGVT